MSALPFIVRTPRRAQRGRTLRWGGLAACLVCGACGGVPLILSGSVPKVLEGHALGAPMERVLAKLRADGWTLEQEARPGGRAIEVRGRQPEHQRLRYIHASFADGALFYIRVGYHHEERRVGKAYLNACKGLTPLGSGGLYTQCASPDRKRALSVGVRGDRVTLLDVEQAVSSKSATQAGVAAMLGPVPLTGSREFAGGPAKGPLPREQEDVRLGDTLSQVLEPWKPPTWKLRTFGRERNGVAYRHVQLRSADHPVLRELLLDFFDHKLVRARFYYRRLDPALVAAQRQACAGHVRVPASMGHSACRDGWRTFRAFDESGRSTQLIDLTAAIASGLMLRQEVDPSEPAAPSTSR